MKQQLVHGSVLGLCFALMSCAESSPPGDEAAAADSAGAQDSVVHLALHDSLFGVVAVKDGVTCLRIRRLSPQSSDSVLVIIPLEESGMKAAVVEPLEACPDETPVPNMAYFRLDAPGLGPGDLGIAIISAKVPLFRGGQTDIDGDGTAETYRACTSTEGVHLTVWTSEALQSPRLWHYYYYLGYDVVPSCVEGDTRSDSTATSTAQ